jgi:hypothetical protein
VKQILDEMMPEELAPLLVDHTVGHVIGLGWRHIVNGKLLTLCESAGFQVFITKDGNMPFQQNMRGRRIAIILLRPRTQSIPSLLSLAPRILALLPTLKEGSVTVVSHADGGT